MLSGLRHLRTINVTSKTVSNDIFFPFPMSEKAVLNTVVKHFNKLLGILDPLAAKSRNLRTSFNEIWYYIHFHPHLSAWTYLLDAPAHEICDLA